VRRSHAGLAAATKCLGHAFLAIRGCCFLIGGSGPAHTLHCEPAIFRAGLLATTVCRGCSGGAQRKIRTRQYLGNGARLGLGSTQPDHASPAMSGQARRARLPYLFAPGRSLGGADNVCAHRLMRALNRHVERVLNPDREEAHWESGS